MREILFRGKAINRDKGFHTTNYKNGDWVYGLVTRLYDERFENLPAEMTNTNGIKSIEVDYKTISQYTGLTDKNGKKIFEGDIVDVEYDIQYVGVAAKRIGLFEVIFYDGCFMKKKRSGGLFHFIPSDKCEIIGNIHDTPELLEVENG